MAEEIIERKKLELDLINSQHKDIDSSTFRSRMKSYSERKADGEDRERALEVLYNFGISEDIVSYQKAQPLIDSVLEKEGKAINLKELEFSLSLNDFTNLVAILLSNDSTKKGKYNKLSHLHKEFAFKYFYSEDPSKFLKQRIRDSHSLKKYESPNKYSTLVNRFKGGGGGEQRDSSHKSASMSISRSTRKVDEEKLAKLYKDHEVNNQKKASLKKVHIL